MLLKLVIVDDEKEIRTGLANYIPWREIGYEVVQVCGDGAEALAYLAQAPVDVMITDIRMPKVTGIDVAQEVAARYPRTTVVFLSAYEDFEYAKKAIEFGVKFYLVKPTVYQEIFDVFTKIRYEKTRALADPREDPGPQEGYYEKIIARVKQYVEANYQRVTLESAAEHVGLNPHYLSSLFRQHAGEKFIDYVSGVKMRQAWRMLQEPDNRVYEVGLAIGYKNANNFARAFKLFFEITPKECRRMGISAPPQPKEMQP